ncbi:hypothetical protein PoMZ_00435, partial [Pyricularia oryzae]
MSKCLGLSLNKSTFQESHQANRADERRLFRLQRSVGNIPAHQRTLHWRLYLPKSAKVTWHCSQGMWFDDPSHVFTPVYELHQFKDFMSTQVDPVVDSLLGP